MLRTLSRWWSSLNYRYCKANEYLAIQRHDVFEAVWWSRLAHDWKEKWNA
jgi:hypothetical protein